MAHGSGGELTHSLIRDVLLPRLKNPLLNKLTDSALIELRDKLAPYSGCLRGKFAFTSDSFVVNPLFFPGGDIGKLAVCGTVNDLVVAGSVPLYLSLSLIIEEGLGYSLVERVVDSISSACRECKVKVVTGDIKVVEKGACDKLFINTAGLGRVIRELEIDTIDVGDRIIVTGRIAEHGLSILGRRDGVDFGMNIRSDCAGLNGLLVPLLERNKSIKFMRDPTRGGLATTLNEISRAANLGIVIEESQVPIANRVKAAVELLGLDPLYIANEGKAILVVGSGSVRDTLRYLTRHPQGRFARVIGRVVSRPKGKVVLKTAVGTERILDMLSSEPLPRIC